MLSTTFTSQRMRSEGARKRKKRGKLLLNFCLVFYISSLPCSSSLNSHSTITRGRAEIFTQTSSFSVKLFTSAENFFLPFFSILNTKYDFLGNYNWSNIALSFIAQWIQEVFSWPPLSSPPPETKFTFSEHPLA